MPVLATSLAPSLALPLSLARSLSRSHASVVRSAAVGGSSLIRATVRLDRAKAKQRMRAIERASEREADTERGEQRTCQKEIFRSVLWPVLFLSPSPPLARRGSTCPRLLIRSSPGNHIFHLFRPPRPSLFALLSTFLVVLCPSHLISPLIACSAACCRRGRSFLPRIGSGLRRRTEP